MTLAEALERGRAVARSWWFLPALAALVCLFLVRSWGAEWRARGEAERAVEALRLERDGLSVAAERTAAQLRAELAAAAGRSADLAAELARARAAAPGARPAGAVHGSTGSVPAGGPATPGWPCAPVAPGAAPAPAPEAPAAPAPHACLLAEGDQGEVRVEAAALRTAAGNLVVVGAAEAWRLGAAPARLFGGPLTLKVSTAAPERAAGWGAGVAMAAGRGGWTAGPAISPPPLTLLGMHLEVLAGAGVGPTGEWAATAVGLVRW